MSVLVLLHDCSIFNSKTACVTPEMFILISMWNNTNSCVGRHFCSQKKCTLFVVVHWNNWKKTTNCKMFSSQSKIFEECKFMYPIYKDWTVFERTLSKYTSKEVILLPPLFSCLVLTPRGSPRIFKDFMYNHRTQHIMSYERDNSRELSLVIDVKRHI